MSDLMDSFADFSGSFAHGDQGLSWPYRIMTRLVIAYILLSVSSYAESQFRSRGIELEARVETVGQDRNGGLRIRYHFRDPVTEAPRMNTVVVPDNQVPTGQTATIEYIPGEIPTSRLKSQARPQVLHWFFWVNVVFVAGIAGMVGFIAWEGMRPIPKSSERRCPLPRRR